jgi:hypothetical protein
VIYLICFDLSEPLENQCEQLGYWLNFLNSASQSNKYNDNTNWVVLLVGLKQDKQADSTVQLNHLEAWTNQFPHLPIFPQLFYVSSTKLTKSVLGVKHAIEEHCDHIFSKHTALIPTSYKDLLLILLGLPSQTAIHQNDLFEKYSLDLTRQGFAVAIQYLHSIRRIVSLKSGHVFPNSNVAMLIAAKFVSPRDVRLALLKQETEKVQILDETEVGCMLDIDTTDNKYSQSNFLINFFCFFVYKSTIGWHMNLNSLST